MNPLTIKDNKLILKTDFYDVRDITAVIADKTFEQLEKDGIFVFPEIIKDAEDISRDQMVLQSYNDMYATGNVMGFLGAGNQRLIIKSRFSDGEDYLFQYLLNKVMDFPNMVDLETDAKQDNALFNLLVFLFPHYLRKAARKGAFKTYIRKQYNDSNVRGTIDVARHIRRNTPFIGNIAYSQREYSYDNYLMELVRHTIEYIKAKPYGGRLLNSAKDEVKLVVDSTPDYSPGDRRKIIEDNKKNTIRHAYYHEYRDLQRLCILILQNEKQQMGYGKRKVYGILFDGAWLWEEYINTLVDDYFYHPMNKAGKDKQWLFSGKTGLIYPDFIGKDADNPIIGDAKYKPISNIANHDYLQVLAYMFRFDAKKAFYFYPESTDLEDKMLWLNSGSSFEDNVVARDDVCLVKHGLKIPHDVCGYSEFVEQIKESEEEFLKVLRVYE
jgi:5-methylcytosine-specific restriction endonuclease McrBC regulatory subunit McrC